MTAATTSRRPARKPRGGDRWRRQDESARPIRVTFARQEKVYFVYTDVADGKLMSRSLDSFLATFELAVGAGAGR